MSPWMQSVSRAAGVLGLSMERLGDILERASVDGENVIDLEYARFHALLESELMTRPPAARVKASLAILIARSWANAQ